MHFPLLLRSTPGPSSKRYPTLSRSRTLLCAKNSRSRLHPPRQHVSLPPIPPPLTPPASPQAFISTVLECPQPASLRPFLPLYLVHVCGGMSHIHESIRLAAMSLLDDLVSRPPPARTQSMPLLFPAQPSPHSLLCCLPACPSPTPTTRHAPFEVLMTTSAREPSPASHTLSAHRFLRTPPSRPTLHLRSSPSSSTCFRKARHSR